MTTVDYFFIFGVVMLVAGVGFWGVGCWRASTGMRQAAGRVVIWEREALGEAKLARVLREWPYDDDRLAAVMQYLQEKLDQAQDEVIARREQGAGLNAAAGAAAWMLEVQRDLVERLGRGRGEEFKI